MDSAKYRINILEKMTKVRAAFYADQSVDINVESVFDHDIEEEITRHEFEQIIKPIS